MAKEIKQSENKRKRSKSETFTDEKKASNAPLLIGECLLRTLIKDKKKKAYDADEVNRIYESTREPRSGFPTYQVVVYPDYLKLIPRKNGRKLKPTKLTNVGQIVRVSTDPQSFLLHIPKSQKTKQFTGLFTWLQADMLEMFEKALREASSAASKVSHSNTNTHKPDEVFLPVVKNCDFQIPGRLDSGLRNASYLCSYLSSSENNVLDPVSDVIRESAEFVETYTHYNPQKNICMKGMGQSKNKQSISFESFHSNDSYYSNDSGESDYICRDKNSIFYGERMSPKSQYIDQLLRATVQMQHENIYS